MTLLLTCLTIRSHTLTQPNSVTIALHLCKKRGVCDSSVHTYVSVGMNILYHNNITTLYCSNDRLHFAFYFAPPLSTISCQSSHCDLQWGSRGLIFHVDEFPHKDRRPVKPLHVFNVSKQRLSSSLE